MRTFCLTLPENESRMEKARTHFHRVGLAGVTFFHGINGPLSGLKTINPYEVDHPDSGYTVGPKVIGIYLSHYMLWSALQLLQDDHFLILEDDAKFQDDWKKRFDQALLDAPPDWDMIYFGSCCCAGRPQTRVRGEVWEVKYPMCLQAYGVAQKALPGLLSTTRKIYAPIDITIPFHAAPLLKIYTVLPSIVGQFDTDLTP